MTKREHLGDGVYIWTRPEAAGGWRWCLDLGERWPDEPYETERVWWVREADMARELGIMKVLPFRRRMRRYLAQIGELVPPERMCLICRMPAVVHGACSPQHLAALARIGVCE
jgi:hypothetical protein